MTWFDEQSDFAGFTWKQLSRDTFEGRRPDRARGVLRALGNHKYSFETIYEDGETTCTRASSLEQLLAAWFTPVDLAHRIAAWALDGIAPDVRRELRVLEPSAGEGNIARGLLAAGVLEKNLTLVEINPTRAARLELMFPFARVICADFLSFVKSYKNLAWDLSVGNPPYDGGLDTRHVSALMSRVDDAVLLLPLQSLAGGARYDAVWSQLVLLRLAVLVTRPKHPSGDLESASSGKRDSMVVDVSTRPTDADTRLEWWI